MSFNDISLMAPALMAIGIPLLGVAGFFATRFTDEMDAWAQRYGFVALLGSALALVTKLPQPLVASAFLTGVACLGIYVYLRRRLESY